MKAPAPIGERLGILRPAGAGCGGWEHDDLACRFCCIRTPVLLTDDIQLWVVAAAERARKSPAVKIDGPESFAALAHSHAVSVSHIGVPDSALGIDADPVGMVVSNLCPDPPTAEVAILDDVEGGEPVAVGLGDDQRRTICGDRHAVGKRE